MTRFPKYEPWTKRMCTFFYILDSQFFCLWTVLWTSVSLTRPQSFPSKHISTVTSASVYPIIMQSMDNVFFMVLNVIFSSQSSSRFWLQMTSRCFDHWWPRRTWSCSFKPSGSLKKGMVRWVNTHTVPTVYANPHTFTQAGKVYCYIHKRMHKRETDDRKVSSR